MATYLGEALEEHLEGMGPAESQKVQRRKAIKRLAPDVISLLFGSKK
jgi:hypothetical protein